jgi:hypothetical protein
MFFRCSPFQFQPQYVALLVYGQAIVLGLGLLKGERFAADHTANIVTRHGADSQATK